MERAPSCPLWVCCTERITRPMIDDHLANQYDQPQADVDRQKSTRSRRSRYGRMDASKGKVRSRCT